MAVTRSVRYSMPNYPCEFEIPDSWLVDAGIDGFAATALAYCATVGAEPVPLREIEPPYRLITCPKDWRGFDRSRLTAILKKIAANAEIDPVKLLKLPAAEFPPPPYRYSYRVRDGYHRFYASIVVGFECVPAEIMSQ